MARIGANDSGGTSESDSTEESTSDSGTSTRTYDWSSYRDRQQSTESSTSEIEADSSTEGGFDKEQLRESQTKQTADTQSSTSEPSGGMERVQDEVQEQRADTPVQESQPESTPQAEETVEVGDTTVGASGPGVGASGPDVQQGIEQTGTGREQEVARDLEQQALEQTGLESQGAVRVTQDGDTLRTELTDLGERRLEEQAAQDIEQQLESGFEDTLRTQRREQDRARALAVEQSGELVTDEETPSVDLSGDVVLRDGSFELTGEGQQDIQGAQADFISRQTGIPLGEEDVSEDGGLSEAGQESVEAQRNAAYLDQNTDIIREINKATTARTASEERAQAVALEDFEQSVEIEQSQRADQAVVGQAKARNTLREEAAESYSEQLGFDVPGSAVEITETETPSGTQLQPSLDAEAAKEAGRGQTDIFSTFVGGVEAVSLFDAPGEGSVANVQSVESYEGESSITETLPEGVDEQLSAGSQWFSETISQPIGDVTGDFFDMAGSAARLTNVADPLAAGASPTDPAGAGKEVDLSREVELFGPRVRDVGRSPENEVTEVGTYEKLGETGASVVAEIGNVPAYADIGYTAADVAATGASRTAEGEAGDFAAEAAGAGVASAATATEYAVENPVRTTGGLAGGLLGGIGVGAAGKSLFTKTRGKLGTRGLDLQEKVPVENIERPDVRSGESGGLTRLSTQAAPEGDLAIPPERLPAKPGDTPAQEIRNIADEFDDPRIRRALDTGTDESVVFRAVSGRKSEIYEPRSRRPYDPDATFLAPSVARNFLDLNPSGGASGGLRLPRPVKGARSLYSAARGEGVPNIVATAGRVEPLPDDVTSLRERTNFLQEQRNTGKFFAPDEGQQTVTGESEVFVSAEGATSTEPMTFRGTRYDPDEIPGTGEVPSGETTRFVEVADPYYTEIRGERVPIQMFRQDTDEVTPLSEQRGLGAARAGVEDRIGGLFGDERGQLTLGGRPGRSSRTKRSNRAPRSDDTPTTPYRPGGQPGTPFVPSVPFSSATSASGSEPTGTDSPGFVGMSDRDSAAGADRDGISPTGTSGSISGVGESFGVPGSDGFGAIEPTAPGPPSLTETPGIGTPTTETPTYDTPAFSTPTYDTPTYDTPTYDTPTGGTPTIPTFDIPTDTTPRLDLGLDPNADEKEREFRLGRAEKRSVTDYYDPLTGERLETDPSPGGGPSIPGLGGGWL